MQTEHLLKCYRYAVSYLTLEIKELKKMIQSETTKAHIKPLLEKRLEELEQDLAEIQQYQLYYYLTLEIEELKKSIQSETTKAHIKPLLEKRLKEREQDLAEIQQYRLD